MILIDQSKPFVKGFNPYRNNRRLFGEDKYNYSKQLAGGSGVPIEYPGDGISMIDKTLASASHRHLSS